MIITGNESASWFIERERKSEKKKRKRHADCPWLVSID